MSFAAPKVSSIAGYNAPSSRYNTGPAPRPASALPAYPSSQAPPSVPPAGPKAGYGSGYGSQPVGTSMSAYPQSGSGYSGAAQSGAKPSAGFGHMSGGKYAQPTRNTNIGGQVVFRTLLPLPPNSQACYLYEVDFTVLHLLHIDA